MARFCKNCGTPLADNATFCGKCGAPAGGAPGPGSYRPAPGPNPSGYRPAPGPNPSGYRPAPGPNPSGYRPAPGPNPGGYRPAPGPGPGGYRPAPGPGPSGYRPAAASSNADVFTLGVLISAAVTILSVFLPFVDGGYMSISLMSIYASRNGFYFITSSAVAIIGAVIKNKNIVLAGGVMTALYDCFLFFIMMDGFDFDKEIGFWLFLAGTIALAVFCVLSFMNSKKG